MIRTEFGDVHIKLKGVDISYTFSCLETKKKCYAVDALYQLILPITKGVVELYIEGAEKDDINKSPDTGERLALISFSRDDIQVSIGTEGDELGITYEYTQRGMTLHITNECRRKWLKANIACLKDADKQKRDIYCWLAADPTAVY